MEKLIRKSEFCEPFFSEDLIITKKDGFYIIVDFVSKVKQIIQYKTVVENVSDPKTEISVEDALLIDSDAQVGDEIVDSPVNSKYLEDTIKRLIAKIMMS